MQPRRRILSMRLPLLGEFVRYGLVSAIALAADAATLLLLAPYLHYLLAATISFTLGGVVAYLLSVRFVFSQRSMKHAGAELGLFLSLGIAGMGINTAIMSIAVGLWSFKLMAAKMLAAIGTFSCNFALRKWLLFSRNQRPRMSANAS